MQAIFHSSVRFKLFALFLFAGLLLLPGQPSQSQDATYTSHVKVVEVPATVRDKHKQIV